MLVYKKTFLSLFPFCCVNNTVHVYCAVYTVTPAPLPPQVQDTDSSLTRPVWCGMYMATDL